MHCFLLEALNSVLGSVYGIRGGMLHSKLVFLYGCCIFKHTAMFMVLLTSLRGENEYNNCARTRVHKVQDCGINGIFYTF